jgi:hypothetical protein
MTSRLETLSTGDRVYLRFLDWIWHVTGSVPLAPGQSSDEAFGRLDPLFREAGTTHERSGDTLTFRKQDQAAQDKMSVFDGGVLRIERGGGESVLRYHMTSRALLFCFLAPLLFLAFAGLTVTLGKLEKPATEAAGEKAEKKAVVLTQNPIDQALGAPAPEKPKKDKADDASKKNHSPTSAYVFAGIFAALYLVGRILEARLAKNLFRNKLFGA